MMGTLATFAIVIGIAFLIYAVGAWVAHREREDCWPYEDE